MLAARIAVVSLIVAAGVAVSSLAAQQPVNHDGDLVLSGSQAMVIEESDFSISGEIRLSGRSTLTIRNSKVAFTAGEQFTWGARSRAVVEDQASIVIENSTLHAEPDLIGHARVSIDAYDEARVQVINSTLATSVRDVEVSGYDSSTLEILDSSITEVQLRGGARAYLSNSEVDWAICAYFGDDSVVIADGLRGGEIEYLEWPAANEADPSQPQVRISESVVHGWGIGVYGNAQVRISNSELEELNLTLEGASGSMSTIGPRHYTTWDLTADNEMVAACDVALRETTIDSWILSLTDTSGPTSFSNVVLSQLFLGNSEDRLSLENCELNRLMVSGGSPVLLLQNSLISTGFDLWDTELTVIGDIDISANAHMGQWEDSIVRREITVVVVEPPTFARTAGVELTLTGPLGSQTVYTTGSDGTSRLMLTFTSFDRDKSYSLHAVSPSGYVESADLSYLTPSPVIMRLRSP